MSAVAAAAPGAAPLADARRLVVKIGSALLVDDASGIRVDWLATVARDIAARRAAGLETVVVSSGAIAVGRRRLGATRPRDLRLEEKQAAAAVGQIDLAAAWRGAFDAVGARAAQMLLTPDDTEHRRRHLNARATLKTLLGMGAVPMVNENDAITTAEIRFGDNDRLAARVAQIAGADALLLLSDVDGLYVRDPRAHADAAHIPIVKAVTAEIEAMAGAAGPGVGSGGMATKLAAARIAAGAGCRMAIAHGRAPHPLARVASGERCTWFLAPDEPRSARKKWIAAQVAPRGALTMDAGALAALRRGASLLPAGVTAIDGAFERGDPVLLKGPDGAIVGRALSAYDAADAERIRGRRSGEIETILGYAGREALAHRDDMALDGALEGGAA